MLFYMFSDPILDSSRHKLMQALEDYTNIGHFAHIDQAIEEVKVIAQQ